MERIWEIFRWFGVAKAISPKEKMAGEMRRMRAELREKYGSFSDSAELIREDRDARG